MQLETKSLRKTINKAFLKETVDRSTFNHFKAELGQLLTNIESAEKKEEHEEHFKNLLVPFLNEVGFNDYYINTSVRIDLAIHTDGKVKDPVGVLLEVKRPSNKNEMITEEDFNRKAMHEAVLYYLEQRIEEENEDLKHIVITDTLNWFVFDAQEFERCYYRPSTLKKVYKSWKTDQKVSSNNDFMYDKIADFIDNQDSTVRGLHLDLRSFEELLKAKEDSEQEKKLIPLFKFFSPTQLLKEPFANDSNTLNREFYRELLYILGLEETTPNNTPYIDRASGENRHPGSFIENTIRILDTEDHLSTVREPKVKYGSDRDEQLFNVALELSIIWMNRILFLKLLEAQLFQYHRQDKKFKFLKSKTIDDYDELNKLFFQVLARRESDRTQDINEKFGHIPYLNSSLFDPSSLEHQSIFISNLDDKKTLPVYSSSVLKDRRGDEVNTLEYLFEFLDAYDFAAEGGEEIQEERKTLINASVLGLIFEKINGYKDGSFFTPGFITEYMAKETLRKTVTDKFAQYWDMEDLSFDDIYNRIGRGKTDIKKANEIVNSITICDPAVGSGHFLVSCLNELLAIKSDLGILTDQEGKLLRDVKVEVENDELIVTYSYEELFEYDVVHTWHGNHLANRRTKDKLQGIQKALFHEKRHIIENCLFGVDINPNSVKICRLRLWIELLKNTYYTKRSDYRALEVLPNIDINIKTGNSLVSRFDLDSDLSSVFKDSDHSLEDYKEAVRSYKHTGDREEKQRLQKLIDEIQKNFSTTLLNNRPINQELSEARSELEKRKNINLFGEKEYTQEEIKEQEEIVKKLEKKKSDQESGAIFKQAFEWRFEFPEVLDEEGNYIGFDVIVENPPYIPLEKLSEIERDYFRRKFKYVERKFETSVLFFLQSFRLGKNGSEQMFIAPLTWETGENYVKLREHIFNEISVEKIINLPFDVFEDAYVETGIFHFEVNPDGGYYIYIFDKKDEVDSLNNLEFTYIGKDLITPPDFKVVFDPLIARILNRIDEGFKSLGEITISTQGLSGSRYDGKSEPDDNDYPYLEEGQAYNYQLIIDEITYTSMEEKKNLKRFYEADPKLLIRRIVNRRDRLDVGYTESKLVFKKDINPFVINDPNFLPKYVLGVMASKFISFLYVNTSSIATKDDFRQTTLTELRNLPIPKVDKERQKKIADLADQVLSQKKNDPEADTSKFEEEIDQFVYEFYGLNEEEIETVEERMNM